MANPQVSTAERDEVLAILAEQRNTLLITVRGIDDAQAGTRATASELTLGGLVKHVGATERMWVGILTEREHQPMAPEEWADQHRMMPGDTLADLVAGYAETAAATERAVAALPDLDGTVPLPDYPWFGSNARWSRRRILLHLIRETAQHSGHADIIRESLDGANTTMAMARDARMTEADPS